MCSAITRIFQKNPEWEARFGAVRPLLQTEAQRGVLDRNLLHLQTHMNDLRMERVLDGDEQAGIAGAHLFQDINSPGPSMCALAAHAADELQIDSQKYVVPLMMASCLAEEPNDLPYHSNKHFKKVVLQMARTIKAHNEIFEGTSRALDERQRALMLIAAAIHDYKHDGKGNTIGGTHYPGRLERQSLALALPHLERAGLKDPRDIAEMEAMLLTTDVSPLNSPNSPLRQLKRAYRYHYLGDTSEPLALSPELAVLAEDAALCERALLLHEADVATSAGISYDVGLYEGELFQREIGISEARPQNTVDFLDNICGRRFLGDATQKLYGANLARNYALAVDDVKRGNNPYCVVGERAAPAEISRLPQKQ